MRALEAPRRPHGLVARTLVSAHVSELPGAPRRGRPGAAEPSPAAHRAAPRSPSRHRPAAGGSSTNWSIRTRCSSSSWAPMAPRNCGERDAQTPCAPGLGLSSPARAPLRLARPTMLTASSALADAHGSCARRSARPGARAAAPACGGSSAAQPRPPSSGGRTPPTRTAGRRARTARARAGAQARAGRRARRRRSAPAGVSHNNGATPGWTRSWRTGEQPVEGVPARLVRSRPACRSRARSISTRRAPWVSLLPRRAAPRTRRSGSPAQARSRAHASRTCLRACATITSCARRPAASLFANCS